MDSDKTVVTEETVAMVLAKKHLHKKLPPCSTLEVHTKNNYVYSCGYYGGCGQIGRMKTIREFGPRWYGLGRSTGVAFDIWGRH